MSRIHTAICEVCTWRSYWGSEGSAKNAATWHVYLKHRRLFVEIVGEDRPPNTGPMPPLVEIGETV